MPFDSMEDKHVPPTPQQAIAALHPQFVKSFEAYGVANPHPGYGTDPNILNVFGHTKYPMVVKKSDTESVIVNNEDEENEARGIVKELKQDGPTVEEYVAAGYNPKDYPPKDYASKSTEKEIEKAIASYAPKAQW